MDFKDRHIAILGAGNLGISIAKGIAEKGLLKPFQMTLTRRNISGLASLADEGFEVTTDNAAAALKANIVFLCVQPKQLASLFEEIRPSLQEGQVLVSVITGVSLDQIAEMVGRNVPIIRAMPNTAIAIGESMTCLATEKKAKKHLPAIESFFQALGRTLVIDENLMQAATVLGASGIAFFMRYLRAATQGGIQMGFHAEDAQLIAVQTAKGAASLILENEQHPEVEIDKVTTPQGCTIEGLNEMEHQGFSSALIKGLMTSYNKIKSIKA
ncbi:MAG: pyrroline-5-carboxylate reductase [Cyclobacteriaceae bacterium]|nr:pyrroline-5-carboxylate reductase [Cyclobacteriaceae bacterium HetDA_MAG_MS6]